MVWLYHFHRWTLELITNILLLWTVSLHTSCTFTQCSMREFLSCVSLGVELMHRLWKQTYDYQRRWRGAVVWEGWTRGLGLAYARRGIWNDWPSGTCCIAQRTLSNILWSSMWAKNLKENGCVYMCNWIMLSYCRYYHNLVNQWHFNKTLKMKKKRSCLQSYQQRETFPSYY